MSSFNTLCSRLSFITEASDSPMDRILPGFQTQARSLAGTHGAAAKTREGRLAMLGILYDLDIIDDAVVKMFKNDPSVSRMVDYFEKNGIASQIKQKRDDIQEHIKDQLANKVSFTTGNRTDAAQQKYELNKLNTELKAAKKVARVERKKETADALSGMAQTVDRYDDLVGSLEGSYSKDYMLEIVADRDSDLEDITKIIKYLSKFVSEDDIDVEGNNIDIVFSPESKLGKIVRKLGVEKIERQIGRDLASYGGAGVVIHEPDMGAKKDMIGSLTKATPLDLGSAMSDGVEEEEGDMPVEGGDSDADFQSLAQQYQTGGEFNGLNPEVMKAQIAAVKAAFGNKGQEDEEMDGTTGDYMKTLKKGSNGFVTEKKASTSAYLTEQTLRDSHTHPKAPASVTFREKYAPQTAKQLQELRNYGL